MSKMGIKETKEAVSWLFDLTDAIRRSADDGKVTIGDAPKFWSALTGVARAVTGIYDIPAEVADIDTVELDEIVNMVRTRFDIDDDKLENYIENLIYHALHMTAAVKGIYDLKRRV